MVNVLHLMINGTQMSANSLSNISLSLNLSFHIKNTKTTKTFLSNYNFLHPKDFPLFISDCYKALTLETFKSRPTLISFTY